MAVIIVVLIFSLNISVISVIKCWIGYDLSNWQAAGIGLLTGIFTSVLATWAEYSVKKGDD